MNDIDLLTAYIEDLGGHDLEQEIIDEVMIASWPGFPLKSYRYTIGQGEAARVGKAVMLNPDAGKAARWIYTAIVHATGGYSAAKARTLATHCQGQSGFQFLIRGVHWEAMDGAPLTAFTFFDGVTVRLRGWNPSWPFELTASELDEAVGASLADVAETMRYARIQGTERGEYQADGGQYPVAGNLWLDAVRQEYQAAWQSDRNNLMNAKAKSMADSGEL